MKIVMIDNYDSFTFNLYQLIGKYEKNVLVFRNDEISIEKLKKLSPDKIVISPGPGRPEDSNISLDVIKEFHNNIPILGVCLGHQAIGYLFGAEIISAPELMHGKTSKVYHDNKSIYQNIPQGFDAGRYHSLIIDNNSLSNEFDISCKTQNDIIMGIRHKEFPLEGIQFHPESILTNVGDLLIKNWLYKC